MAAVANDILGLVARQAATSASSAINEVISTTTSASSTSSPTPDRTSQGPAGPSQSEGNGGGGGGGGASSPLLFFVALGFGVVFTNLWIIVGVKYCFRYNARNRQMRLNEDGEPITLENMPRPHRRRREKKLMTMEEVNEKFPMMKYKSWVLERAKEGLPTAGGVSAPPSRAGSVRSVQGIVPRVAPEGSSKGPHRDVPACYQPAAARNALR
ncbi:RING-8 protein [Verticillium alfalfae VaMs.102]|uniref:RING-8 protein n=1 Tax=Verticillium alfalfae (strain VaMs.102 / ATCC MYA-4576 / FGSC 10136) TaxID=526221 RepID=C9SH70_VERA1|nr:RING-8 protein [Verticillium alfalfae VaMs.102]EEY17664.1 RING-8 protein [Verticillium alfalfae VaMs.102]